MFTLEALKAKHGDCLILQWGAADAPHHALIDGGPPGTWASTLRPRLAHLERLELLMVSHIDDDHIAGVLDLLEAQEEGGFGLAIERVWFNSLEGLLDRPITEGEAQKVTASLAPGGLGRRIRSPWKRKVLASVPQGQRLTGLIRRLGLDGTWNFPYAPLVLQRKGQQPCEIAGLRLTPVAPSATALETLRRKWIEKRTDSITAAFKDASPYNLSSIVVIAEFGGRSMLLTGDANGRDILAGLKRLGRLDAGGRAHFDLIKLPHHGSQNNVTKAFFAQITADHYVVSGDHGKFPNPHEAAMRWLAEARAGADYRVHCTYDVASLHPGFDGRLSVPAAGAGSVRVQV